jgi:hypothetical protein
VKFTQQNERQREGERVQTRGMVKDSREARLVSESRKLSDFLIPVPGSPFFCWSTRAIMPSLCNHSNRAGPSYNANKVSGSILTAERETEISWKRSMNSSSHTDGAIPSLEMLHFQRLENNKTRIMDIGPWQTSLVKRKGLTLCIVVKLVIVASLTNTGPT